MNQQVSRKLYVSRTDKKMSGVCGGIGEYLGVDSTAIRLLWILMTILTGIIPGVIAYIIAAVVMPDKPTEDVTK